LAAAIVLGTISVAATRPAPPDTDPAGRSQVELLASWAREADVLAAVSASNVPIEHGGRVVGALTIGIERAEHER
jgi:hypothetical protein